MYYIQMMSGFIFGQLFFMAICSYFIQKKLPNIDYFAAFKVYFKAEFGGFVVAISFVFLLLFVLSDFIDLTLTRQELLEKKETLTKFELIQKYFKSFSAVLGIFGQIIPFIALKKGLKAIRDYSKQNGLDDVQTDKI